MITKDEHRERHKQLHRALDELLADFIKHSKEPPLYRPIIDLAEWSYQQTLEPDEMKFFVEVYDWNADEVVRSIGCNDEGEVQSCRSQLEEQVDRRFFDVRVRVAD